MIEKMKNYEKKYRKQKENRQLWKFNHDWFNFIFMIRDSHSPRVEKIENIIEHVFSVN